MDCPTVVLSDSDIVTGWGWGRGGSGRVGGKGDYLLLNFDTQSPEQILIVSVYYVMISA